MFTHIVELINDKSLLAAITGRVNNVAAFALDIETINWWDRDAERVSLVQLAFREDGRMRVAVIDALAGFDLELLRQPLEISLAIKAIHNASFDAVKMARHFGIATSPIFDTMLAARRSGERRCSLQAQVEAHLGIRLDKAEQRGDWSRRPLSEEQLNYASLDAVCTLLLYELQTSQGLRGDYELRSKPDDTQRALPLTLKDRPDGARASVAAGTVEPSEPVAAPAVEGINPAALSLLGIIVELSGRYIPEQLIASVGAERVGLAGWIVDRLLGFDADLDESTAKEEIVFLREEGLVLINSTRRLEATTTGESLWQQRKPRD
jgi:hypothetical protein